MYKPLVEVESPKKNFLSLEKKKNSLSSNPKVDRVTMLAALALGSALQATTPVLYGYDVVEYFSLDASASGVKGSEAFAANLTVGDHSNATIKMDTTNFTFFFKDDTNLQKFQEDPWKYAPQWGGF